MNGTDDSPLVARAQAGDRVAFGQLVSRYGGLVHGLCLGMTRCTWDAEDLAHDAFVEAWLNLSTLRDPGRFAPWLRTVTLNVCRMWHRQRRRQRSGLDEAGTGAEGPALPTATDDDRVEALSGGLARLSSAHRLALALHYWEGLSYEEIAAFLDVAPGTVMSRLHRARARLKEGMTHVIDEGVPGGAYETLRRAVDAEIEVLVQLWGKEAQGGDTRYKPSGIRQRLSVLLARRPDLLAAVYLAMDEVLVDYLALLLTRIRTPAVDATVACAFSDDGVLRERARLVLRSLIGKAPDRPRSDKYFHLPVRAEATLVLDALIRGGYDDGARADLVADVIAGSQDEATKILLSGALLCWADEAFPRLWDSWWAEPGIVPSPTLAALSRVGTRFLAALTDELDEADPERTLKALAGACAVADLAVHTVHGGSDSDEALGKRVYGRVSMGELDREVALALCARAAKLLDHPRGDLCDAAVRLLGALGGVDYLEPLRRCLRHARASTRREAIVGVSTIGDEDSVGDLMRIAAQDELASRIAALQALGHLGARAARDLLIELTDDPTVRRQAISALGEIDDDVARATLEVLMKGADKRAARTAATARYGGTRTPRPASATTRERLRKIRGAEAAPWLPVSLVAAIRNLPELRTYEEPEITRLIGEVCSDYSTTRRELVMGPDIMVRNRGVYQLTELGQAIWRVEHFLRKRFEAGDGAPVCA